MRGARSATSWPEAWLSVSADIAPVLGEYERTSTTVLNAYVTPRVVPYLRTSSGIFASSGLAYPLLLIQSNGGAASVEQLVDRAVMLALSGPAAGASALRATAEMAGRNDLVLMEIGGTSCDVTLMDGGEIAMVDQLSINGYHLTLPSVDIHSDQRRRRHHRRGRCRRPAQGRSSWRRRATGAGRATVLAEKIPP